MLQVKSIFQEEIKTNPYLFINFVFAFFPFSFIFGSFIVNFNLLLFCCLGIFCLKSKILTTKYDLSIKIIFLFFLVIFLSTTINVINSHYFAGDKSDLNLTRFVKSILFFRYFLFLIIIYLLNKFDILDFKYFFLTAAFASSVVCFDIIFQYIFGFNTIGFKQPVSLTGADEGKDLIFWASRMAANPRNSGFFGDEYIAGGYIQRFAFFAIFFTFLLFKNKNYMKFIFIVIAICFFGAGILVAGNRMPLVLFLFGLFLLFLTNFKIKKILFVSLLALAIIIKIIISSNAEYKQIYHVLVYNTKSMMYLPVIKVWSQFQKVDEESSKIKKFFYKTREVRLEPYHERLFLTAVDTWKFNKVFGNGIKSFREVCHKLRAMPDINMEEKMFFRGMKDKPKGFETTLAPEMVSYFNKKNRLCSNHPHNYYFEILTETGAVGLIIIFIIALFFLVFLFKNRKLIKQVNVSNFILLSAIISLILETMPLRSSGSLFTTNNATYIILIASIVLSYKKILKIKIE
tara:strand:- start:223 stop:1770 length:1548 start_codon:yes stop_codon:yes gene_type:complete